VVERVLPSHGRVVIVFTCSVTQDVSTACNLGHRRQQGACPQLRGRVGISLLLSLEVARIQISNQRRPFLSEIFRSFISWKLRERYVKLCREKLPSIFFHVILS
jgi:hypothetical protein